MGGKAFTLSQGKFPCPISLEVVIQLNNAVDIHTICALKEGITDSLIKKS
jgi:hypothetical protein